MLAKLLLILIVLVVLGSIIYLGVSWYIASQVVAPHPSKITLDPSTISPTSENITVAASDGVQLRGWLFKDTGEKLVIMVHGIKMNRVDEAYGSTEIAKYLIAQGFDVLLFDARGHGESGGKTISLGIKDSDDLVQVVELAKQKGYSPENIAIIGNSFGAITTILAADKLQDVGALIVDSAATDVKPILSHVLRVENNVPDFIHPGVFLMMKLVFGVDVELLRPIDKMASVPDREFLFLHGEKDELIPLNNSELLLSKANKKSLLVVFSGAGHVQTYKTNPILYTQSVMNFLDTQLSD